MHWRFLSGRNWLFLSDPEWLFQPGANIARVIARIIAKVIARVMLKLLPAQASMALLYFDSLFSHTSRFIRKCSDFQTKSSILCSSYDRIFCHVMDIQQMYKITQGKSR